MKKGLIFLLILLVVIVGAIYLFIPNQLKVARELVLNANSFGVYRSLSNEDTWDKWWPKKDSAQTTGTGELNGYKFNVEKRLFKTLEVSLSNNDKKISSGILFIPMEHDSSLVRWEVPIETGSNPFQKVKRYFEATKIANTISTVLNSMKPYLEIEENIYSLSIKHSMVRDTAFISTRTVFHHFPSTEELYSMIAKLHEHIAKQNGKEVGHPMLNIDSSEGTQYEVMVAIATDRLLPEQDKIKLKRMIQGNILVAEVTGGPYTIKNGMMQMHEYLRDHQMTAAAIPFQLLITDRSKEKDTSKWVTELRYPVF